MQESDRKISFHIPRLDIELINANIDQLGKVTPFGPRLAGGQGDRQCREEGSESRG